MYSLCGLDLKCTPIATVSGSETEYSLCWLYSECTPMVSNIRLCCCVFTVLVRFGMYSDGVCFRALKLCRLCVGYIRNVLRWSLFHALLLCIHCVG